MFRLTINAKNTSKPLLNSVVYVFVFMLMNGAIAYFCNQFFGVQQPLDWVLVGIYFSLSIFSYYAFVVNDINAKSFKDRFVALGFFSAYLSLTVLVMSFIFNAPVHMVWYIAGLLFSLSYLFGLVGFSQWSKKQHMARQQLQRELLTDELTQLYNRRALAQHAPKEEKFARNANSHISVLMIDIDDFKPVNDKYGHAVGDHLLQHISALFKQKINKHGEVYRWGGEEFVVLLPITGLFEANQLANKLINKVSEHTFDIKQLLTLKVTVSIGVAQWLPQESISKETLERADKALYRAKSAGKNSVVVADFKDISHIGLTTESLKNKEDQTKQA